MSRVLAMALRVLTTGVESASDGVESVRDGSRFCVRFVREGVLLAHATNRWMRHHSGLTKEDEILDAWKAIEHWQIITVLSVLDNEKREKSSAE
ncbi:hypothetical protein BGZ82_002697 [Podila clonocystis]|nr:hypothetical protein BGZ82_002697 [Podila clonocystis]